MSPSSVSVVIPPPTIDLDTYEFFGEVYSRTVDEILSDEASFDATFDSYTSDKVMDRVGAGRKREAKRGSESTTGHTKSPYFHTDRRVQRPISMDEHRSETEVESEDEDEDAEEDDDALEADIIFASVRGETRDQLLKHIASHPFMSGGVYPVERSKRRAFVRHVCKKAKSAGLDEEAIARLTRYVKKTYLELYGNGCIITLGSEYGDELGDGGVYERKSMELSKKDRKRKRANGDKTKEKSRKIKKASTLKTDTSSVQLDKHSEHEVIDLDADSEDVFANSFPNPRAVKDYSVFGGSIKGRALETSKQLKSTPKQDQQKFPLITVMEKRNGKNSVSRDRKYPYHLDSAYREDAICLESDIDFIKKPLQIVPAATHVDQASSKSETPDERAHRLSEEKNRRKNEARKRRKVQRQHESLKAAEAEDFVVNDTPFESQPMTKKYALKNKSRARDDQENMLNDPFWTLDF